MSHDIRLDSRGQFDELIVADPKSVHIERMDAHSYWMRVEQHDGPPLVLWFEVKKAPSCVEE